jgi:hypothetical protein
VSFLAYGFLIALMMEAASTSETLVNFYQTTCRYNPEDSHLQGRIIYDSVQCDIYRLTGDAT